MQSEGPKIDWDTIKTLLGRLAAAAALVVAGMNAYEEFTTEEAEEEPLELPG